MKPEIEEPSPFSLIFRYGKWALLVLVVLIIFSFALSSVYTVDQNEVAGVTRYGSLISAKPVGPGIHFKLPWIDEVHTIRTSIDKIPIPEMKVKTVDNQFAQIDLNLTFHTADPFKAMFQVGQMGNGGVIEQVIPFVQSRTLQVFGQVGALKISDQQVTLALDILNSVKDRALALYGEQIDDVQITKINYSPEFEKNIELMVQTQNQQVSAENILKVRQTEAKQAVAIAQGAADSRAAQADGEKRVAIAAAEGVAKQTTLQADANAYSQRQNADAAAYTQKVTSEANAKAIEVVGVADADAYAAKIKAVGSADAYGAVLRAEATQKWTGAVPQYQFSGAEKGGAEPVVILPQESK